MTRLSSWRHLIVRVMLLICHLYNCIIPAARDCQDIDFIVR
ncbi:hypothetical protein M917_1303 [Psychrobacter aquaticus CMS 56]|uniref:Uncharacterized protein n=1 Tax=Psychrobacter aquaticus CMS 56 TaxID=1354303 RepID=U4T6J5_9GAMM|nr:hypothetical protein M917_1303 [Psychrobacter aquaticus CMS 56]